VLRCGRAAHPSSEPPGNLERAGSGDIVNRKTSGKEAITAGAFAVVHGADAYTPRWLYQGTWKATSRPAAAPPHRKPSRTSARESGYSSDTSRRSMEPGELILFLPAPQPGQYYRDQPQKLKGGNARQARPARLAGRGRHPRQEANGFPHRLIDSSPHLLVHLGTRRNKKCPSRRGRSFSGSIEG
jgi:hypothetical protein